MTTKSITSGQEKQIARFTEVAAGNAALAALEQVSLGADIAQAKVITAGDQFQALVQPEFTKIVAAALNKLSGRRHSAAEDIEKFYFEVLGISVDLTNVRFPEKAGFLVYMAVAPGLNEDAVMGSITKHFKVGAWIWKSPIAANIDRASQQKRSEGLYVFSHVGGDEPDAQHLGKSYDDAVEAKMVFVNPLEYLLMTGFHMWKHGHWLDSKSWTRTSSLWSDGHLVCGRLGPQYLKLDLYYSSPDYRHEGAGPRELFLG